MTLLGPGGAGKTRLSQEAAETVRAAHPDGVWLAELAPVDDPDAVAGGGPHRRRRPPDRAVRRGGHAGRDRPAQRPRGPARRALQAPPDAADPRQLRARRRGRRPPGGDPPRTLSRPHRPRHQP
ncbi:hypothetical protein ACFQV4_06315 [Streptomyces thermocarboxydus]